MSRNTILFIILALVLGGIIGYLVGAGKGDRPTPPTPAAPPVDTTTQAPADTLPEKTDTTAVDPESPPVDTTAVTEAPELPTLPPQAVCIPDEDDFSYRLSLMAERFEADSLWYDRYNPERLLDCSGIFHRVLRKVKGWCGEESYRYPAVTEARHTRALARWYHEQGALTIITDARAQRNLIRPGSVLFFGTSDEVYARPTVKQVTSERNEGGIVQHMGVVTKVERDEEGNIKRYVMFHGRRTGVFAQRTYYHSLEKACSLCPPLGNYTQQLVGLAFVTTTQQ